jgi:hypothetical protein
MSRYGVSIYGLSVYGTDTPVAFAASGFTATPKDYGTILLEWNNPAGNWSKIKLVRNTYGFPIDYLDGTVLDLNNDDKYEAYKETAPPSYLDTNLATNAFYYYSLFVFERINYKWIRISDIIGLSVKEYGYSDKLFEYVPDVYKTKGLTQAGGNTYINISSVEENQVLKSYLDVFAFELNKYHTLTNLLFSRYDTSKLNGLLLPSLLQELGLEYEPEIGYQQARILTRDAVALYKGKGSRDGVREFLKAFTGYAVPTIANVPNPTIDGVTVGPNKMLDYNDSSFEESIGRWVSGTNATLACLKVKKVSIVALTSNVLTLTIGTHDYKVGNQIYVFGFDKPLFNQTTAVTLTAVTGTTVSFALTGTNYPSTTAWNPVTNEFPTIAPYPNPWDEPTTPTNYPNLQKGILAVKNSSATAGTVKVLCGSSAPITKGIPVTAGLAYSFSFYTVNSTTTRQVTAGIDWYTRFGVYISSFAGTATASGTGAFSTRVSVAASGINVAPATAYYAVPTISIANLDGSGSTEFQYFDCAQFEQSATVTDFDEARQLRFTLKANRINELKNPHFASVGGGNPNAPWVITGATPSVITSTREPEATVWDVAFKSLTTNVARIETVYTHDYKVGQSIVVSGVDATFNGVYTITAVGERTTSNFPYIEYAKTATNVVRVSSSGTVWVSGNALKLIATATGTVTVLSWDGVTDAQRMPIHYPGTAYTFSVYSQLAAAGSENLTPRIIWYDASNAQIDAVDGTTVTVDSASPDWERLEVTATAPTTAHSAAVSVEWAAANTEVLYLDSALFENAPVAFTFFNGSSGFGDNPDYVWEGTANASRSHYYKNRYSIQVRTANATFKDKLPMGTTVAIYLGQPKT